MWYNNLHANFDMQELIPQRLSLPTLLLASIKCAIQCSAGGILKEVMKGSKEGLDWVE